MRYAPYYKDDLLLVGAQILMYFTSCAAHVFLTCGVSNPHALYLIQQGEFVASLPMGQGTYTWPDGNTYDGEVYNCLRHGIGTYKSSKNSVVYTGQWGLGKRHGTVRFTHVRQVYISACFSSVFNAGSHIL